MQAAHLTRRRALMIAAGAGIPSWFRLYAGESEFWNKKDPSEWSREEVYDKLTTKSLSGAKEVAASTPQYVDNSGNGTGYPSTGTGPGGTGYPGSGTGYPGGGGGGGGGRGMGMPGMGGGGMGGGRGRGRGGNTPMQYKGTVRWESASLIRAGAQNHLARGSRQPLRHQCDWHPHRDHL